MAGFIQVIIHSAQAARGQPRPEPILFWKMSFLCVLTRLKGKNKSSRGLKCEEKVVVDLEVVCEVRINTMEM